jgi:hypothetical protein
VRVRPLVKVRVEREGKEAMVRREVQPTQEMRGLKEEMVWAVGEARESTALVWGLRA